MERSRNSAGGTENNGRPTLVGGSRPFWEGLWVGFSRHMGVGTRPATVGRCFGDGRKADGRRLADSASHAEFNARPRIARSPAQKAPGKAVGRRPVCRLAREMPAFAPASDRRLTPTVRRAGSFRCPRSRPSLEEDAPPPALNSARSRKTAPYTKLRGHPNCPSPVRRTVTLATPEGYRRRTEGDRKVDGRFRLQSRIQGPPAVYLRRQSAGPPEGGWKVVGL